MTRRENALRNRHLELAARLEFAKLMMRIAVKMRVGVSVPAPAPGRAAR
jgi:hypothetical protein